MRKSTLIGFLLTLACLAVVGVVVGGVAEPTALVALAPLGIGAVVAFVLGRIFGGMDRQGVKVRELVTRGVPRRGVVRDALPIARYHGGASFTHDGAHMALQVDLEPDAAHPPRRVQVDVIEPSETARARIGTTVVVLEHPDDPDLLALEGRWPSGRVLGTGPLG